MKKLTIGGGAHATTRPPDLDAQLAASTGCTAAEIAGMLAGRPSPDLVARALLPFLPEESRPGLSELAEEIAADDTVAGQVAALYSAKPSAAKPPA